MGINDDPTDGTEDDVETFYFAQHDARYCVIGLVDDGGTLVERYDYTPYGSRVVLVLSGLSWQFDET